MAKCILWCWRATLIYFQSAKHCNYEKEAILLQAAVNATATLHVAAQITWGRVNTSANRVNTSALRKSTYQLIGAMNT